VETLRRLLGHSNVATTGKYLDHLELADLRDALPPMPTTETTPA
jgi:site-specific recombinase XerD